MNCVYGYPIRPGESLKTDVTADNLTLAREQAIENFRTHCRMAKLPYFEKKVFLVRVLPDAGAAVNG